MNAIGVALVLALTFCLCACSGTAAVKLAGGTWTEAPDAPFRVDDYTASGETRTVPADWVLPEDLAIDGKTRTEVCGEYLLFGPSDGSVLSCASLGVLLSMLGVLPPPREILESSCALSPLLTAPIT